MSPLFLTVPLLVPISGGFTLMLLPAKKASALRIRTMAWTIVTTLVTWICLFAVKGGSARIYSFIRGFSIELRLDGPGLLFAGMVSVMWPFVTLYAFEYMKETGRQNMFFGFFTMTYGIALGVAFAANMTTLYVFFELLTLVTIPLVSYYGDHESLYAGRKYAAYTIGGASLAFFAVVMASVYGDGGTFRFGGSLNEDAPVAVMQAAFIFGFFGFGVKAAVFPFHGWLPTASAAPTPVTALLHAVAVVNSGVVAVIRLSWYVYGKEFLAGTPALEVCAFFAVFTLMFAAVGAVRERHLKKRLAWSTISNLSYMLFGVMLMTESALAAGMAHLLFHGVIKMTLFLCAGAFMHVTGKSYIYQLDGAGRRMPVTFTLYTISALSLTGIPALCGFVSKWKLVTAGIQAGTAVSLLGACALIAAAFLCAIYTLSISVRAFFPVRGADRFDGDNAVGEAPVIMLLPMAVFTVVNIFLGIHPQPVLDFLGRIAKGAL